MTPDRLWAAWNLDPLVVVGLVAVAWAYARGVRILWRGGRGRGISVPRAAAFGVGLSAVTVALVTPVEAMAEALLAAHMLQHVLLVMVAAPLLVLGAPLLPLSLALPRGVRRVLRRWQGRRWMAAVTGALTAAVPAWMIGVSVLWAWHVPVLYQAALRSEWVHAAEHASLLATALLFWWVPLGASGRSRLAPGADVLYVFTGGLQGAALGALFTFSAVPFYPAYASSAAAWGLGPLQDQQLAGVIMWIPSGVVYLVAASGLFVRWIRASEEETREGDRRAAVAAAAGRGS